MAGLGRFRDVLELQRRTDDQSALGGSKPTWTTYATVRGQLVQLRGRALESANIVDTRVNTSVTIHHQADVRPQDRVVHDGDTYDVIGVVNVGGRRRLLELLCEQARAKGS